MSKRIVCTVINDLTHDQRMHKICAALAESGYHVTLVGRKLSSSQPFTHPSFATRRLRLFFNSGKLFYLEYNIRLFFLLLFFPADIFYAVDLDTILPHTLAGRIRGKKRVYDAHEYFTEVPEVVGRPRVQAVWRWVERTCVPHMHLCYTVSQSLAELFGSKYGKTFHVIRNVPVLREEDFNPAIGTFLLYQGALNTGRGLEALIVAMKHISMPLYIAGEGDLSEDLRSLAEKEGVGEKVRFLGWVSPKELKKLTRDAYLGYNVLENMGLSYYYSLSNKFFDYMHAGVPSLSSAFPEYENIIKVENTGLLVPNLLPETLVSVIERVGKDQSLYAAMKENCRSARHKYCWQAEAQKLKALFDEL